MNQPENFDDAIGQVLNRIKEIHPNIAVISSLSNHLKDPNADMDDIAQMIKSEPSLTADMIRISNSPFYGAASECADIESALARIGFNNVLKVVSLLLSQELSSDELQCYDITPHEMWAESVVVSYLMETLSKSARINVAKAGTAGILHNVGRVIVDKLMVMFGTRSEWDPDEPIAEWEEAQVGLHYGEAGARFLKDMQFPEEIQDVIRHHVYPGAASRANPLTQLLRYNVLLSNKLGRTYSNIEYEIPDIMLLQPQIGLYEEDVREAVSAAQAHYQKIKQKVLLRRLIKKA